MLVSKNITINHGRTKKETDRPLNSQNKQIEVTKRKDKREKLK